MFKHYGRSIVERMSTGGRWFNPGNIDGKRAKEGACYAHGVDRGPQILTKIRQRGLRSRTRATDLDITFKDSGSNAGGSENDSGRKAVRSGADNGRGLHALTASFAPLACAGMYYRQY